MRTSTRCSPSTVCTGSSRCGRAGFLARSTSRSSAGLSATARRSPRTNALLRDPALHRISPVVVSARAASIADDIRDRDLACDAAERRRRGWQRGRAGATIARLRHASHPIGRERVDPRAASIIRRSSAVIDVAQTADRAGRSCWHCRASRRVAALDDGAIARVGRADRARTRRSAFASTCYHGRIEQHSDHARAATAAILSGLAERTMRSREQIEVHRRARMQRGRVRIALAPEQIARRALRMHRSDVWALAMMLVGARARSVAAAPRRTTRTSRRCSAIHDDGVRDRRSEDAARRRCWRARSCATRERRPLAFDLARQLEALA